jgi:hypothetical protein
MDYIKPLEARDRVAIVVREVSPSTGKYFNRLVMLKVTENGYEALDEEYAGYNIDDGVVFMREEHAIGLLIAAAMTNQAGRELFEFGGR